MGNKIRACKSCKKKKEHLRKSSGVTEAFVCKECGASSIEASQVCAPVRKKLAFSCKKCGRLSSKSRQLCKPEKN